MKRLIPFLLFAAPLFGQGTYIPARTVNSSIGGVLRPVQATITVCAAGAAGVPCAPPLAGVLFKDSALTQPLSNPTTTDANGNYPQMALAGGNYTITESAVGFTGFYYQITISCSPGPCTVTSLTTTGNVIVGGNLSVVGSLNPATINTNNLTVSGPGTFTGASSFKNLQNVRYVSPTNIEGWSGSNAAAWANAAATDLGGAGTVYFRSGTYTFPTGNTIVLVTGVQFSCVGYRSCILTSSTFGAGDYFFTANSSVSDGYVGNFKMVGNGTGVDDRGISTQTGPGILTRFLIENNDISQVADGIDFLNGSSDNWERNNYIHNFGNQGSAIQGDRNHAVENRVDTGGTTNLHHGFYVQQGIGSEIVGNHITNVTGFCIHNFSQTTSAVITSSRIDGNFCSQGGQAASGIRGGIAFAETTPATGNRQGVMANNTIENTNGNPIYASGADHAAISHNTIRVYQGDCITVQSSSGVTVTGITVDHNQCFSGSVSGNGIRVNLNGGTAIQNITVDHNFVDSAFGVGIWLQGCTDCNVTDNRVKDYNIQGSFSNAGIRVESTSLRNRVSGNNVTTVNVTGAPPPIYIVDAASTDNQIFDNYIVTSLNGAAYADSGTRDRIFGNHTTVATGFIENVTAFDNLFLNGLIKNRAGTTIMGLALKKGSGAGNYTNATTSYTVADSTNLCYTVTIPTGWKLGVSASGALSTATAAVVAQAALTDNAACSTANAGILVETAPIQGAAIGVADAFALNWVITGDGASHNIAMQFKTSNAADTASLINSSATVVPTMKFELMPSN